MFQDQTVASRSLDEIAEAIRSLSTEDWIRLRKAAFALARHKPIEPEDLLQEAFQRALQGSRNCPTNVDVVRFLAEAMRSIASGELQKIECRPQLVPIASHGFAEDVVDPPDPDPGAEQHLATHQDRVELKLVLLELFNNDPTAQIILEGMMEEMEGEELRELTDLDKVAYQSKRKLIRRRIDAKFPGRWKQ